MVEVSKCLDTYALVEIYLGNEPIDGTGPFNAGDSYITVRGRDLANPGVTDFIEPDTFSVDQLGTCSTGNLLDNDPSGVDDTGVIAISVVDVAVTIGASVTDDLFFCMEDINPNTFRGGDPITVDSYSSTNAGNSWEINVCASACPAEGLAAP
jgi:hypothetical protein